MPSLKETLELIVTSNVAGGVAGLEKVGASAEKNLGKTASGIEKVGGKMQTVGATMVGFAAVGVAGLSKLAMMSEEATAVTVKLNNAVQHAPQITDKSTGAYEDLAESLAKVTVFDDDATKSMQANLIATGRTREEVLALTPAIQDLAVKTGDLDSAGKLVTAALNGKKKGLEALVGPIDDVTYKTDRYAAVTEALARVQGLATEQGKTFSGQLAIAQNRLGELAEGVGVGAVSAFSNLFGALTFMLDKLEAVSPGAQSAAGELATYATIAGGTVGVLSFLSGSAIKAAKSLGLLAAAEGAAGGMALTMAGKVVLGAAAFAAFAFAVKTGIDNSTTVKVKLDDAKKAAEGFATVGAAGMEKYIAISKNAPGIMHEIASQMAEQSLPAAEALADALDRTGGSSVEVRKAIDEQKSALQGQAQAADASAAASAGLTSEEYEAAEAAKEHAAAIKEVIDQMHAQIDPLFAAEKALRDNQRAQEDVTGAEWKLNEALKAQAEAHRQYKTGSDEVFAADLAVLGAQQDLTEAHLNAAESALSVHDATIALADAMKNGGMTIDGARAMLQSWVAQGLLTQESANAVAASLQGVADRANELDGRTVSMYVNVLTRELTESRSRLSRVPGIAAAKGFAGTVSSLTRFTVAEGGEPEDVLIVPHSKGGIGVGDAAAAAGGSSQPVTTIVQLVLDSKVVAEVALDGFAMDERRNGALPLRSTKR